MSLNPGRTTNKGLKMIGGLSMRAVPGKLVLVHRVLGDQISAKPMLETVSVWSDLCLSVCRISALISTKRIRHKTTQIQNISSLRIRKYICYYFYLEKQLFVKSSMRACIRSYVFLFPTAQCVFVCVCLCACACLFVCVCVCVCLFH